MPDHGLVSTVSRISPMSSKPNQAKYRYSVKIINPSKKRDYSVLPLRVNEDFETMEQLKDKLLEKFPNYVSGQQFEFGYIGPGHGARGKQRWIINDDDLEDMYSEYQGKKEVILWLLSMPTSDASKTKTRSRSPVRHPEDDKKEASGKGKSKSNYERKLDQVETILGRLKEKQLGRYPEEKLRAWAHLIQMEKHASYNEPPDLPFFRGRQKSDKGSGGSAASASAKGSGTDVTGNTGVSPSKKLLMRTQCIEQLDKWHTLLEKGGITQSQYSELQEKILSDMKDM